MLIFLIIKNIFNYEILISSSQKEVVPIYYKEYRLARDLKSPTFTIKPKERVEESEDHVTFLRNSNLRGYKMYIHNTPICLSKHGALEACFGDEDDYTLWKIENRGKALSICTQKLVGENIMNTTNFCITAQKNNCSPEMPYFCIGLNVTPYNESSYKQLFLIEDMLQ